MITIGEKMAKRKKDIVLEIGSRGTNGGAELITKDNNLKEIKKASNKERIKRWHKKAAQENLGYKITKKSKKSSTKQDFLEAIHEDPALTDEQKNEVERACLYAATGLTGDAAAVAFSQVVNACFGIFSDMARTLRMAQEVLVAMNPQDAYEGMLCGRLFVLHNHYMVFMQRASKPDQSTRITDLNINRATKLMRLYNETFDSLNRYRRKGEQKVTVKHQHINIGSGGQAAVGNFQTRGRGDNKK